MEYSRTPLQPEGTYHIYNRAVGDDILFKSEDNFRFFLSRYGKYISPVADTFCYCLMPNHFHFLIRIKDHKTLNSFFNENEINVENRISQQFSNLFNSYTKAYNKQNNRIGSLFMKPFKRKVVKDEQYLKKVVHYIHYNPVSASLAKKLEGWKFSSFRSIISKNKTRLCRQELISWFDDVENFVFCHSQPPSETGIDHFF